MDVKTAQGARLVHGTQPSPALPSPPQPSAPAAPTVTPTREVSLQPVWLQPDQLPLLLRGSLLIRWGVHTPVFQVSVNRTGETELYPFETAQD